MKKLDILFLNLIDESEIVELPEGLMLVDTILFTLIVALLIYTYFKVKKSAQTGNQDELSERQADFFEKDVLIQPKSREAFSGTLNSLTNFSVKNALLWLLGLLVLFVILNIILLS